MPLCWTRKKYQERERVVYYGSMTKPLNRSVDRSAKKPLEAPAPTPLADELCAGGRRDRRPPAAEAGGRCSRRGWPADAGDAAPSGSPASPRAITNTRSAANGRAHV